MDEEYSLPVNSKGKNERLKLEIKPTSEKLQEGIILLTV